MGVSPATPVVAKPNGTTDLLVYAGRTFRLNVTHTGLADPSGYKARFALKSAYSDADTAVLAAADSDDGDITLTAVTGGTLIEVVIPDESMELAVSSGKYDLVLESSGGEETTILLGSFTVQARVTP